MAEIIAGRNPVSEALKAGRAIDRLLVDGNVRNHGIITELLNLAKARGIPVEYVTRQTLDRQGFIGAHQGVVAYAAAKEYASLNDLLAISRKRNEPALYVVLDGMEDPHNLGAILRTAEATGVHGVILRSRREVGITPAVVKASAGAAEYMPVAQVTNISQTMGTLKKENIWVVGVDMAGDCDYTRVNYKPPTAIVIGGEGKGLSPLVRKRCDGVVFIPMKGKITSLNASVAEALVMYEAMRQRSR